jgi:hypothetical protein
MPNQESVLSKYALPIVVLLLIALAIGGWFMYQTTRNNAAAVILTEQFNWSLRDVGTAEDPKSDVSLRIAGVDVPIGEVPGRCTVIDGEDWELLPGELTGIICQKIVRPHIEIGVFEEGGGLVLKRGDVNADARTNFVPIFQPQEVPPEEASGEAVPPQEVPAS